MEDDMLQTATKNWLEIALPDLLWFAVMNDNPVPYMGKSLSGWLKVKLGGAYYQFLQLYGDDRSLAAKIHGGRKKRLGCEAGVPDLFFILPDGKAACIELKIAPNKPSDSQVGFIEAVKARGCKAAVCYSGKEIQATLECMGLEA